MEPWFFKTLPIDVPLDWLRISQFMDYADMMG